MSNPFQDQLLKAGLVTKKQVQKVKQDKNRKRKQQQQHSKKEKVVDEAKLKVQQAVEEKTRRDRELNRKKRESGTAKSDFYRNQSTHHRQLFSTR